MPDKSLIEKAIDFKGKPYILVSDRVLYFNDHCPTGSITTELLSKPEDKIIVVKATVRPDDAMPTRVFVGHSQAVIGQGYINTTSALENAETSAVGRALAMMGIGIIESIASADEIVKAKSIEQEVDELGFNDVPFASAPANELCKICGGKMVPGKNGKPYCKPCYVKWANENKKV